MPRNISTALVNRHTGGLETNAIGFGHIKQVNRHTGGLEIINSMGMTGCSVNRHTGGLETDIAPKINASNG